MKKLYEEEKIQAIADAIRAKTGKTDKMKIGDMSSGVDDISLSKVFDEYISGNLTEIESDVESVGDYAFAFHQDITKATLPNVTTIGEYAFAGTGIAEVCLNNIENIGAYAFADIMGTMMLSHIYAPKLKVIAPYAFFGRRIRVKDYDFESVISIGDYAFLNCVEPYLSFPNAEYVGPGAFMVQQFSTN